MPHKLSHRDLELLKRQLKLAPKQQLEPARKQQKGLSREGQIELVIRDFRKAGNAKRNAGSAKRKAERDQGLRRYTFEELEQIKREGEQMIKERLAEAKAVKKTVKDRKLATLRASIGPLRGYRRGCITELDVCITDQGICRRTGDKVSWSQECADCGLSTEYCKGPVWCEDFDPIFSEFKLSI